MVEEDSFFRRAEDEFYNRDKTVAKVLRVIKHQTGKTSIPEDRKIKALQAGKRISKTGHVYWETRKNRSDLVPAKKL